MLQYVCIWGDYMYNLDNFLKENTTLEELLFSLKFILIEEDNNTYSIKSIISKERKVLIICNKIALDAKNFLLCYKIAEYLFNINKEYISITSIDTMDMNIYPNAKIIYNHYKGNTLNKKKIL